MNRNFDRDTLSIGVSRRSDNTLRLEISSDFSQSNHKSQLYVNENRLADMVEQTWKSIKTKKLQKLVVSFGEIDYYDDMTNVYETPVVRIERGLRRAKLSHREHGSIPKDWSFDMTALFSDTTTNTPILEVIKNALGSYFTPEIKKAFVKSLRPVLQKKVQGASYYANN